MKIRQGFVSNSSSSSFIIAVPKGTIEVPVTIKTKVDLLNFKSPWIDKAEDVIEDYPDSIGKKMRQAIAAGKEVIVLSCSDEDGGIEAYLCENGLTSLLQLPEGVEIILGRGYR
jgi:hypothetical protein